MQQFEPQEKSQMQKTYVALRIRPSQSNEKFCEKVSNTQIRIRQPKSSTFQFDRVFDENENTQIIFDQMVQPMLDKSLCGFNALICAYGQTSSGKTYTMRGSAESPGLIQYSAEYLFNKVQNHKGSKITMQYFEIYKEQIYDLLSQDKEMKGLKSKFNCQQVDITSLQQMQQQYKQGEGRRHQGSTSMNIQSSRSHVLLELILSVPFHEGKAIHSKVLFVDLAGSEDATKESNVVRRQEGSKINKSLLAFSTVVNKIKDNQVSGINEFINYRDSYLTFCLKTCLDGNSQLGFLFTINQEISDSAYSISTIQFSKNAGAIKSKLVVNQVISDTHGGYDERIKELTEENQNLNEQIELHERTIQQLKEQVESQYNTLKIYERERIYLKQTNNRQSNQIINFQREFDQGKISVIKEKQEIQDQTNFQFREQQNQRQSTTFPVLNTPQKEQSLRSNRSEQQNSPSINYLNDFFSLYNEIKTQKFKNHILKVQLMDALQENLQLQKVNKYYEQQLNHKLQYEEDSVDTKQFYENMEIPEPPQKQNVQTTSIDKANNFSHMITYKKCLINLNSIRGAQQNILSNCSSLWNSLMDRTGCSYLSNLCNSLMNKYQWMNDYIYNLKYKYFMNQLLRVLRANN